jgi:hypothetical protein
MGTDVMRLAPLDATTVARLKRDSRLLTLCEAIGADPNAVLSLPADIGAALPAIIEDAREAISPAADEEIIGKLVEICAGLGMGVSQKEKTEWQAWACVQLSKLPRGLMLEGLEHASRTCERLNQVVKVVFDYAESYPARMRVQLDRLEAVAAAAQKQRTGE